MKNTSRAKATNATSPTEHRAVPGSEVFYNVTCDSHRTNYLASLCLSHGKTSWNCYLGDVVAVSKDTSFAEDWDPMSDKNWEPALVVGLAQVIEKGELPKLVVHTQSLRRAMYSKLASKLKAVFDPRRKLPRVLLATTEFEVIDPLRILPAKFHFLDKDTFHGRGQTSSEDSETVFQNFENVWEMKFHVPKLLDSNGKDSNENPDIWVSLGSLKADGGPPAPLKRAWKTWEPARGDPLLLQGLIKAFTISLDLKRKQAKKLSNQRKEQIIKQANEQAEAEKERDRRSGSKKKRRVGFQDSEMEEYPHKSSASSRPVEVRSILKKSGAARKQVDQKRQPAKKKIGAKRDKPAPKSKQISKAKAKASRKALPKTYSPPSRGKKAQTSSTKKRKSIPVDDDCDESSEATSEGLSLNIEALDDMLIQVGKKEYYMRVEMDVDEGILDPKFASTSLETRRRVVQVGDVLPLSCEDATSYSLDDVNEWFPFESAWAAAQIVSIFFDLGTEDWMMEVRWFDRFSDLLTSEQEMIKQQGYSLEDLGSLIFEKLPTTTCSVDSILPGEIRLGGDLRGGRDPAVLKSDSTGLPRIFLVCQHYFDSDGQCTGSGWEKYYDDFSNFPFPLKRGVAGIRSKKAAASYRQAIAGEVVAEDFDLGTETNKKKRRQIKESSGCILEKWGLKFVDTVTIDVRKAVLEDSFHETADSFDLKVGTIVPVSNGKISTKASKNLALSKPYRCDWHPAQITSIYQHEGAWMAEVRWFYKFTDLQPQHQEDYRSMDKRHVVFETEHYEHIPVTRVLPGRIVVTSTSSISGGDRWNPIMSSSGTPVIPRLCQFICLDDEMDTSNDWWNFDRQLSQIPDPLKRGLLLTPRNRLHKDRVMILARVYRRSIRLRQVEQDDTTLYEKWNGKCPEIVMEKTEVKFIPTERPPRMGEVVHSSESLKKDFSMSVEIPFHTKYLIKPSRSLRKDKQASWTVNVGDSVCFANESAGGQADHILLKHESNPWHPFLVRWSFAQVLAIYRDRNSDSPQTLVELRLYHRESELYELSSGCIPPGDDLSREEVFETPVVIDGIPASALLSPACAFLGQHQKGVSSSANRSDGIPSIPFRCKYFFLPDVRRFQPLYCSSFTPERWYSRVIERGCSVVSGYAKLEGLEETYTNYFSSNKTSFDARELCFGSSHRKSAFELNFLPQAGATDEKLVGSASFQPTWENFEKPELFFHPSDRNTREEWTVSIGDLVAVKSQAPEHRDPCSSFPFTVSWIPCQILSIRSLARGEAQDLLFRIRELIIESDRSSKNLLGLTELKSPSVGTIKEVQLNSLVGPLTPIRDFELSDLGWESFSKFLPLSPILLLDRVQCKAHFEQALNVIFPASQSSMIMTWLKENRNTASVKAFMSPPAKKGASSFKLPSTGRPHSAPTASFRIDVSTFRSYLSEVKLMPQYSKYSLQKRPSKTRPWVVKMGDIVLVEYAGEKRFPMTTNWGVAEVICMWKQYDSEEDLEESSSGSFLSATDKNSTLKMEIRWFSRRAEMMPASDDACSPCFEEIFETDETEIVDESRLLSQAVLHGDPNADVANSQGTNSNGMPIQEFYCGKFWSVQRRSLIPCGGIRGMTKRGRLYSKCLTESMFPALSETSCDVADENTSPDFALESQWQKDFESVIKRLTLKDSSSTSYIHGDGLVGREQEIAKMLTFLRAAIRGDAMTGDVKTSIFLAGPPGVGKTACVRSAIAQLRQEQARGDLPNFQFFSLNGMEMRHPVEAYIRLWEGVSGGKEIRSAERACANLEDFFTSEDHDGTESISVVLLDEIDYLVTEKQTVLYNFFDWPKRAAEMGNGKRLIVIGISNTLNLAEQFLPSIQSRIGSERCCFKAYNLEDIISILKAKISEASPNHPVFEEDAILFASKKTAALCGDIRKAFQICRAAAELVMKDAKMDTSRKKWKNNRPIVRISDVQKGSRSSFNTALVTAVSFSTPYQALLLVTVASLGRSTGRESGGFDIQEILLKMESLCGAFGDVQYAPPPTFGETLGLLVQLGEMNLVEMRTPKSTSSNFRSSTGGSGGAWPLVSLVVDDNTLLKAFRGTMHQKFAENFLSSF